MAQIRPFRAIFYNQDKFRDLSELVCPPYDVISPAQQDYYHNKNAHNFIHILLRKDNPAENKYQRCAQVFREWLKERVLTQALRAALYFYSQEYNIRGEKKTRLGFISLLRLGDKGSPVHAHENTRMKAKEDRLKILTQTNANLSPIFVVLEDKKRVIQRSYDQYIAGRPPFIEVTDKERTLHKLWSVDEPEIIEFIGSGVKNEDAFIADGHHRYEVSCAYRDRIREKLGDKFDEESSFNYTLSYFTSADQRGLTILPIHRLLRLEKALDLASFLRELKVYFDVEEVKAKERFFFLMEKAGRNEHLLGMYKDKRYWLLRLKNVKILDKMMQDKPKEYRSLDVSILNNLIFKAILKYSVEDHENLQYSPHPEDFIAASDSDPLAVAFFLNPVKMEQIMAVAAGGNKMPPKSTYFYPKVLSGLVINKHEDI